MQWERLIRIKSGTEASGLKQLWPLICPQSSYKKLQRGLLSSVVWIGHLLTFQLLEASPKLHNTEVSSEVPESQKGSTSLARSSSSPLDRRRRKHKGMYQELSSFHSQLFFCAISSHPCVSTLRSYIQWVMSLFQEKAGDMKLPSVN